MKERLFSILLIVLLGLATFLNLPKKQQTIPLQSSINILEEANLINSTSNTLRSIMLIGEQRESIAPITNLDPRLQIK